MEFFNREKRHLRNDCVRLYVITGVLDFLVLCKFHQKTRNSKFIPFDDVKNWLDSHCTFDYAWRVSYAQVQLWIQEMVFLDLIKFDEKHENICLTENGYNAYKSQQYHFAYASLIEAKSSRLLSKVAILISILATILALLIDIMK